MKCYNSSMSEQTPTPRQRTVREVLTGIERRMIVIDGQPRQGSIPNTPRSLSRLIKSEVFASPEDVSEIKAQEARAIAWLLLNGNPHSSENRETYSYRTMLGGKEYSAGTSLVFGPQPEQGLPPDTLRISILDGETNTRVMYYHSQQHGFTVAATFREPNGKPRCTDYAGMNLTLEEMSDEEAFLAKESIKSFLEDVTSSR